MRAGALPGAATFHILRPLRSDWAGPPSPLLAHSAQWFRSGGRPAMAMDANEIERLIKAHIPDAEVTIRDLAGDGDHYAATVLAESFRGKSRVQQHQIVYQALKGEMGGKLHALALQTGTPERSDSEQAR